MEEEKQQQQQQRRKKGGFFTMPFIIANESLEKVASYGLMPNMILYLMKDYKMSLAQGTNLLFMWSAATNFMPLFGAFLADSYLGRFLTIGFGSISSLLGMILLWLTTMIPHAKPPPCNPVAHNCSSPSGGQLSILVLAFLFMSIGAGGVRPCSQAFGADQLDNRDHNLQKNKGVLEMFFNWYYACACLSVVIALTVIVYIQDHFGWRTGFGVPVILMSLSVLSFFLASSFYVNNKARKSLFTSFAQVLVAAYCNREVDVHSDVQYHSLKDSRLIKPSDKLRFLNKACIIRDPDRDVSSDGKEKNPWRLSTVEEVEELKVLIRALPIWSSGIMLSINTSQNSFPLLQAQTMDRHLSSKFQIPAGSYGMFMIITIVLWIPIYDRLILPLASRIRGKPVSIHVKARMGIGLFFTFMAMVISGIVESIRRKRAIIEGYSSNSQGIVHMSAMWLAPQHCLNGLAEAFTAIGQTEFFYSEFPKSMSSIATSLFGVGMGVANLLASAILSIVNDLSKKGGKESWVSSNINKGHYEYYYWILAIMSFVNFLYYVVCSRAYGPCRGKRNIVKIEESGVQEEKEETTLWKSNETRI